MEEKDLDKIREYEQEIENATNCFNATHDPYWLDDRANYYALLGKFDLAIADCKKAIEINPSAAVEPYSLLSRIAKDNGDVEEAFKIMNQAIGVVEDKYEAYTELACLYSEENMHLEAIETYLKMLEFEECYKPDVYNYIGTEYAYAKQYDKALEFYNKAVVEGAEIGEEADGLRNIGYLYYKMENYPAAIEFYTKAIEADEEFVKCYLDRGFAYYRNGEEDKALQDFKKALELNPDIKEKVEKSISEKLIPGFSFDKI